MIFEPSKHDNRTFLVFDVESIGLHGPAFAWGGVLIHNGRTVEGFAKGFDPFNENGNLLAFHQQTLKTTESDQSWVKQNVLPALLKWPEGNLLKTDGPMNPYQELYRHFNFHWCRMMQEYPGVYLVADCAYPVETNFLASGHGNGGEIYPLLDLATLLYAAGRNPLSTFRRIGGELPAHDPLCDARQSARIWLEMLEDLK